MNMIKFQSFSGTITMISDFATGQTGEGEGCNKLIAVENTLGALVNLSLIHI